ncbi:MAG: 50S ribosomal protein L11 methyltransferase [Gemmatimonadota bacterium]|nr:50S ribosomal protein L11 methyltransferase [Gemmatimonadota bacterium]
MSDSWRAVRVERCADRDAVMAALFDAGSQGIHEDGDALVTHFPPETDADDVVLAVKAADRSASVSVTDVPAVDWSEWRANVDAHHVGRLTVTPPWRAAEFDPATTIIIDPAMAFGTGEHPTTRGMLRLMHQVIRDGDTVADLGAGSAVLSIAAAKLGATRIAAIEIDSGAEASAIENVRTNHVESSVRYLVGDAMVLLALVAPVRVVLANIVSSVLVELLPGIAASLAADGVALFSGILVEEQSVMTAALERAGFRVRDTDIEGDWLSIVATCPA